MISASSDCTINIWSPYTQQLVGTCREHTDYVMCVTAPKYGRLFYSGGLDGCIYRWRFYGQDIPLTFAPTQMINSADTAEYGGIYHLALSNSNELLAAAMASGTVMILTASLPQTRHTLPHPQLVHSLLFSLDDRFVCLLFHIISNAFIFFFFYLLPPSSLLFSFLCSS